MSRVAVAIVGAGPYGLSLAAHLSARKVENRIFGQPMRFWSDIAEAGGERYLKSFCFGTNLSTPAPGYSFADYNEPRGLETFEPCSIANFTEYGRWFQQHNVPWAEPVEVEHIDRQGSGFAILLSDGERLVADRVVIATGLSGFAHVPPVLASLPPDLAVHTSRVTSFAAFRGRDVAVIGAGQSALEAAALLCEAGARPLLLVRESAVRWHGRSSREPGLWERVRWPISGLGSGLKAKALTQFPGALHRVPVNWRTRFVNSHLPAEGAWWLRDRVETRLPIHLGVTVVKAREVSGRVALELRLANEAGERRLMVDHVIAGSGYEIDVGRLMFISQDLRTAIKRLGRAPQLNANFEASVPGLHFVGPSSAMSFGPLFRFVIGAEYSARMVSRRLSARASLLAAQQSTYWRPARASRPE
ncbi:NAD(P)-binding domain-containing protein [Bradyrhizobium sp. CCGUVB23]|uniref:NAD(P)-binding domain-containing protein n=1 Tax=Bradyrhizobium sp. CCGUVB23 TaxID=2949630 RepID=UPI0020B42027|nr:NAD(P)-binding domain-containing protein [Bradyrhizobium sp. CCGUVB23]MCP3460012.1 NAD(P)-binding domain-containing protein [Bradyrhizobium sp. CCGUVB23]